MNATNTRFTKLLRILLKHAIFMGIGFALFLGFLVGWQAGLIFGAIAGIFFWIGVSTTLFLLGELKSSE